MTTPPTIDVVPGRLLMVALLHQRLQEILGPSTRAWVATAAMIDAESVDAMLAPLTAADLLDVTYESAGDLNRVSLTSEGARRAREYLREMRATQSDPATT